MTGARSKTIALIAFVFTIAIGVMAARTGDHPDNRPARPEPSARSVASNDARDGSWRDDWVAVLDDEHLFAFEMPEVPEVQVISGSLFITCAHDQHGDFAVVIQNAGRKPERDGLDVVLLSIERGALAGWSSTPNAATSRTLDGPLPGREASFRAKHGEAAIARFFLAETRYIVMLRHVATVENEMTALAARRFLDSLTWRPGPRVARPNQEVTRYQLPLASADTANDASSPRR